MFEHWKPLPTIPSKEKNKQRNSNAAGENKPNKESNKNKKSDKAKTKEWEFKKNPDRAEKPPLGCINCKEDHWLDQCPKLKSKAEIDKVYTEWRRNKAVQIKRVIWKGEYKDEHMVIENKIQLPVIADSGTSYTVGPEDLKYDLPNLEVVKLPIKKKLNYMLETTISK